MYTVHVRHIVLEVRGVATRKSKKSGSKSPPFGSKARGKKKWKEETYNLDHLYFCSSILFYLLYTHFHNIRT